MSAFDPLLQSGVKFRCACGAESTYQRETKLPPFWSLDWKVIDGRSWPIFRCAKCVEDTALALGHTPPREQQKQTKKHRRTR